MPVMSSSARPTTTRGLVHGLVVDSALPLLNTAPVDPGRRPDLTIRCAPPTRRRRATVDGTVVAAMQEGAHRHSLELLEDGAWWFEVPDVMAAAIDPSGSFIEVAPVAGADPEGLQLVVSGLLLAVTLS